MTSTDRRLGLIAVEHAFEIFDRVRYYEHCFCRKLAHHFTGIFVGDSDDCRVNPAVHGKDQISIVGGHLLVKFIDDMLKRLRHALRIIGRHWSDAG